VEAVAPPPAIRDLEATPERPARRDARERTKAAKAQKSERPRFSRSQPAAEQESRGANPRQAGITDSRAYQLPSGRRIVVFRQANGEVGIAPAERRAGAGGGGGSYFFDW
jgi:hypothetical protein